ncbi:MAG: T9SS type A sorting domain-containing protein [Ignavibacteria bacterium]|nr:T9SS type A sorting domain-containing protein [Ignavibacteria bacterium]
MKKKFFISAAIIILLTLGDAVSKPTVNFMTTSYYGIFPQVIQEQIRFDPNNIDTWIQNTGIFDQDIRTTNTPGFMWMKGSNSFAVFTAGLSIGTYIDGSLKLASCSYKGEYEPGYINITGSVPIPVTNANFKLYKVTSTDSTSSDYLNWGNMVPYGAPYVDRNNNGQFDPGIDRPGIANATQTIYICMTDGFPETHNQSEGFSGGTAPIFSEVHLTAWGYKGDSLFSRSLSDVQFLKYEIINKSTKVWNNAVFGLVTDPDLGNANDDYIGCDTALNLGYCYNSDNMDGNGNSPSYGLNPPAVGFDYLISPIYYTGNPNDSVVYYNPPGSDNRFVKRGYRQLGMTSFVYFTGSSSGDLTCEQDPTLPIEAYRYLSGIKKDGSSWIHPSTKQRAKKLYAGNPETGEGWSEFGYNGNVNMTRIKNCAGGDTITTYPSPPGDRRLLMNTGGPNFSVNANDTVRIVLGQMIARGVNNKNAVTKLKKISRTAQIIFDMNFKIDASSLPIPVVTKSITPFTSSTCGLNLYWSDTAEYYRYTDTIFHTPADNNTYRFQGYEVYEVDKNLASNNYPDFGRPVTINSNYIKLLKIFDRRDTIGVVIDTLPTGVFINGNELYSPLPIVPPYGLGMPAGFPESGLSRLIKINQTQFPQNYGGNSAIQYGQTYKFIICAYAVSDAPNAEREYKVIRNPLGAAVYGITPQPPSANTTFNLHNGDTINTNHRDLGVKPVVVGQEYIQSAKYRVLFYPPDTSYSVLKSTNNGVSFFSLRDGLKVTPSYYGSSHDSSRIFDGILFKTDKIKSYNKGVIRDPTASADSLQTRKAGWEYLPSNQYVTGSKYMTYNLYQSQSMSISYPSTGTFNNLNSQLRADQLRKVKIVFSNMNKQYAFRYLKTSNTNFVYQSMTEVPFKVFMTDSTVQRQLNCAFVESNDVLPATGHWTPGADSLGRQLLLYVFNSSYDTSITSYKTKNLFISNTIDVMYIWAPRLISAGANFTEGDSLIIYPYTVTLPGVMYEFTTYAPTVPVIEITSEIPEKYDLMQNYPNPFNPETKIRFALPEKSFVVLKVYNVLGQLVEKVIDNRQLDAGVHQATFNGSRFASGIYFYRIETEKYTQTKRMVLIK